MTKNKYIILFVLISGVIASCKKDQYYVYNDVSRMQFGPELSRIYTASYDFADTFKRQTFYYYDNTVKEDTVFFDIYAIGGVRDVDRTFALEQEQVANATNAIAGKQYVDFKDPRATKNFVIKAGAIHTRVPIILLRDPSLKTTTPVLKIKVATNDNFQLGEASKLWRKIEFTDRLSQPGKWTASFTQYYFGKYSVAKHAFLIEATQQKWDDAFIDELYAVGGLMTVYQIKAKMALTEYNNVHPGSPLTDEFGELVAFP